MAECQVHPSRHLVRGLAIATGLDTRPSTGPTNPPFAVIVGLVPALVGLLRRFRSFVAYVCGTTRFADHCGSSETHNHDSDAQRARQINPLSIARIP